MKLSIIVPWWSSATLGMPTGPETRATMPYDLVPGPPATFEGGRLPRVTGVKMVQQ